jgi:hypothetical protein
MNLIGATLVSKINLPELICEDAWVKAIKKIKISKHLEEIGGRLFDVTAVDGLVDIYNIKRSDSVSVLLEQLNEAHCVSYDRMDPEITLVLISKINEILSSPIEGVDKGQ